MDDLDDLLNEVEKDLERASRQSEKKTHVSNLTRPVRATDFDDEIDSILDDNDDLLSPTRQKQNVKTSIQTTPSTNLKCKLLYLGGSNTPSGIGSISSKRSCDRLRCTSCDFKVEQFNDFEWAPSVDYLFLRNNMPDFRKLSQKLRKKSGCRAYACQCSWKSVNALSSLNQSALKWVCGRH